MTIIKWKSLKTFLERALELVDLHQHLRVVFIFHSVYIGTVPEEMWCVKSLEQPQVLVINNVSKVS